jgi:hypothetical protein
MNETMPRNAAANQPALLQEARETNSDAQRGLISPRTKGADSGEKSRSPLMTPTKICDGPPDSLSLAARHAAIANKTRIMVQSPGPLTLPIRP